MIIKYKINKEELLINIKFLYEVQERIKNSKTIYKYINLILKNKKIKFNGKKITLYINGLLIGTLYLTNYYTKKINYSLKDTELNTNNSYFSPEMVLEIYPNSKKVKTKKVLTC